MAPHSSTLSWKIPWTEEPGRLQSMGLLRVGHNWAISLSLFTFMHWRRKWQPTSVLAWRIPGMGEPGGLPSMGLHRVGHDWSNLAAAAALYEGEHKGEWNEGLLSLCWIGKKVNPERGWKMGKSRRGRDREQEWRKKRQTVTETENRKDRKLWAKTEIVSFWWQISGQVSSVQSLSCVRLCDPMDRNRSGLPVHCQLPEFAQTHVHWACDGHPIISSFVVPFSSCFQSFPASGSLQMSQFFASNGQSIGVSATTSVLSMNIQDWSPLRWTGLISLESKGLSRVFSNTTVQKHQFFCTQLSL